MPSAPTGLHPSRTGCWKFSPSRPDAPTGTPELPQGSARRVSGEDRPVPRQSGQHVATEPPGPAHLICSQLQGGCLPGQPRGPVFPCAALTPPPPPRLVRPVLVCTEHAHCQPAATPELNWSVLAAFLHFLEGSLQPLPSPPTLDPRPHFCALGTPRGPLEDRTLRPPSKQQSGS